MRLGIFIFILLCLKTAWALEPWRHWEEIEKFTKTENWSAALGAVEAAIAEHPSEPDFHTTQAWVLRNLKRNEESVARLRIAVGRWPKSEKLKEQLAYSLCAFYDEIFEKAGYRRDKMPAGHEKIAEDAYALRKFDWSALVYGSSLRMRGKYEAAVEHFALAAKKYPNMPQLRENYGWALVDLAYEWQKADAQRLKLAAAKLVPRFREFAIASDKNAIVFHRTLARIADATEDFENAARFQRDELLKHPEDYELMALWGSTLNKLQMKQRRKNAALADKTQAEGNQALRAAMRAFETKNPNRPRFSGLHLPLKGRVLVVSEFDGGGTHSGFDKYSYDFVLADAGNFQIRQGSSGTKNSDHLCFGSPVYAAEAGEVIGVNDGYKDLEPSGEIYFGQGNDLQIRHDNGLISHYAHLKRGSIRVKKGDRVTRGQAVAQVGNSGLSYLPHLHFTVVTPDWVTTYFDFGELEVIPAGGAPTRTNAPLRLSDVVIYP